MLLKSFYNRGPDDAAPAHSSDQNAAPGACSKTLKGVVLKPHLNDQWVIPPDANAAFVAAMKDVIEVYHRLHDPDRPVVWVDETSKQLIIETRTPIPAKPGQPRRVDYEYKRNGTANLFMMFAPLEGWRDVRVTDQRAAVDYAQVPKELSDTHFPQTSKIAVSCSNRHHALVPRGGVARLPS